MKFFVLVAIALTSTAALAAPLPCGIHPIKGTPADDLPALAKVSRADAQKTALSIVKTPNARVTEGELEVEHGCLVYSFDVHVPGNPASTRSWSIPPMERC